MQHSLFLQKNKNKMQTDINIRVSPEEASDKKKYLPIVAKELAVSESEITDIQILRRSIDARQRQIKINLRLRVFMAEAYRRKSEYIFDYQDVSNKKTVIIVGAGPAGLFAALQLIELGLKPIIFERGKDVQSRRKDIAGINKHGIVLPDSNYGFGEGGAGTFSDGKLYTRSSKRGDVRKILNILHLHGAPDDILIDAHPHIGTDKLPQVIRAIRETILEMGGEVHFETRIDDLLITDGKISGVVSQNGEKITASAVILATGHSARDIYQLLDSKQVKIESKPFAMGLRVEHPQALIDSIQYRCVGVRSSFLPAASYSLVKQVAGRGVYSFCMCPGGFIVPAATAPNELVVNGMSPASRNSRFANSGMVVEIKPADWSDYQQHGALAAMYFQQHLEQLAFRHGGENLKAPAQALADFVSESHSAKLPESSYMRGLASSKIHEWLPPEITKRLQAGFKLFDKKMKGFLTNEAVVLGVESRSSSPVKIPRDKFSLQHVQIAGLFPCGEGAGYAGGIVSAAIDGERSARAVAASEKLLI